jgi:hypothetical protein
MRPPLQERSLHHDPQPAELKKLLAYVIGIGARRQGGALSYAEQQLGSLLKPPTNATPDVKAPLGYQLVAVRMRELGGDGRTQKTLNAGPSGER